MRTILWNEDAKKDLVKIISFYNKRNGNSKYSTKLVSVIKSSLELLKTSPYLGVKVANKKNYRVLIIKEFKIFYKVTKLNIEIVLIWDSRQNPNKLPKR